MVQVRHVTTSCLIWLACRKYNNIITTINVEIKWQIKELTIICLKVLQLSFISNIKIVITLANMNLLQFIGRVLCVYRQDEHVSEQKKLSNTAYIRITYFNSNSLCDCVTNITRYRDTYSCNKKMFFVIIWRSNDSVTTKRSNAQKNLICSYNSWYF